MDTLQLCCTIGFDFGGTVSTNFETILLLFHTSTLASWYFGKLSRPQAEKLLKHPKNQNGAFLIRDSESQAGQYALSVRHNESIKHYRIRKLDQGGYFITQTLTFR
jgi:SH2 domain